MAGGKQTPRQRMINILYLVLLGLIALNVPESLLDSFKKIGDSLSTSTRNVQEGINSSYKGFQKHLTEEPARAKPIYDKAQQATALTTKLYNDVEALKAELAKNSGGMDEATGDYHGRDNMEEAERLMIKNNKGEELKKEIADTKEKLIALLDEKDRAAMKLSLDASDPTPAPGQQQKSWEEANFGANIPVAAVMTTFVKIQSDAKNDEAQVTKKLMSKFDVAEVTLNKFEGVAVAPTSYIIAGQPYTAQVFLTAYDSQSNPVITINGSSIPASSGKGTYTVNTSKEGIFTYSGDIAVKGPDGVKHYPLPKQTYQVAKPSAVVSPEKMNVLYIGLDNPLAVSAPGIPSEKLKVSMSNGSLSGGKDGHYQARVSTVGTTKVTISAEVAPGKTQVLSSSEFRIKRVPPPLAQFGGRNGGNSVTAVNLRGQDRLFAKLVDFEFDTQFTVTSFTMYIQNPRQDVIVSSSNSNDLTGAQKAALATLKPGGTLQFDNIVAVGPSPSHEKVQLTSITFRAQ